MNWQIIIFIAIFAQALSLLLSRKIVSGEDNDPRAFAIAFQIITGIFLLLAAIINGLSFAGFAAASIFLVISFSFYAIGNILKFESLKLTEASVFAILSQSIALWTILSATLLLGQKLAPTQLLGAFLVLIGVLLTIETRGKVRLNRGVVLALGSAIIFGLAFTSDAVILKSADVLTYSAAAFLVPGLLVAIVAPRSVPKIKNYFNKQNILVFLATCLIFSIGVFGVYKSYQLSGNASRVAPVNQATAIIVVALGALLFGEKDNIWQKSFAVAIAFVGVLLLV